MLLCNIDNRQGSGERVLLVAWYLIDIDTIRRLGAMVTTHV